MKIWFVLAFYSLTAWSFNHESNRAKTFRNQIHVNDPTTSTITESSFQSIPSIIYSLHAQDLQHLKIKISLSFEWEKPFFSAWVSELSKNNYRIGFWGGLARIPGMNEEAHALLACHEFGHILGGAPSIKLSSLLWSSTEGQSDYFASGVCLKRYFSYLYDIGKLEQSDISREGHSRCRRLFHEAKDFQVCQSIVSGIESLSKVFTYLDPNQRAFSLLTPSRHAASETIFNSYPESQCRIDTLWEGLQCPEREFPCLSGIGQRPICWFRSL